MLTPYDPNQLALGEEVNIRAEGGQHRGFALGFVRRTAGGFFRAYHFEAGAGHGPFFTFEDAELFASTGDWRGVA